MIQQLETETVMEQISSGLPAWRELGYLPREAWELMGSHQWIGISSSPERGLSAYFQICKQLLESKCIGLVGTYSINEIAFRMLRQFAAPEVEEAIQEIKAGRKNIALCLSEEHAGSDINQLATLAELNEDGQYVLQGKKVFITNAPIADYFLVAAKTAKSPEAWKSISLFLVKRKDKGVRISEAVDKAGAHMMPFGEVVFEDCVVREGQLLGRKNRGFEYFANVLDFERTLISILSISVCELIYKELVVHLNEREIFGKPLKEYQHIKFVAAEYYSKIAVLKHFTMKLIEDFEKNEVNKNHIFVAKIQASELLREFSDQALQLFGGKGYLSSHWISNIYNDIRWLSVGGGANEMLKDMLGNRVIRKEKR